MTSSCNLKGSTTQFHSLNLSVIPRLFPLNVQYYMLHFMFSIENAHYSGHFYKVSRKIKKNNSNELFVPLKLTYRGILYKCKYANINYMYVSSFM